MPRYPKEPLEDKLAWMRERQREKEAEARLKQEGELKVQAIAEQAARLPEGQVGTAARRRMLRVDEVAGILRMSDKTVRRWFRDRAVVVRAGRRKTTMLISEQILDDFIRDHTGYPKRQAARR
jgi:hypothetical protein